MQNFVLSSLGSGEITTIIIENPSHGCGCHIYEVKEAGLKLQTLRLCQPSQTGDTPLLVGNSKICNPNLLFTYIYFLLPKPGTCDHYAMLHFIGKTVRFVIGDSRGGGNPQYLFIKLDTAEFQPFWLIHDN